MINGAIATDCQSEETKIAAVTKRDMNAVISEFNGKHQKLEVPETERGKSHDY